jgi:hypothetical protein
MATGKDSWHSVNEVSHGEARCCVSNYYFSRQLLGDSDYFHATSFRGEPKQVFLDLVMRADNVFRTTVLRLIGRVYKNPHVYKQGEKRMRSDTRTP